MIVEEHNSYGGLGSIISYLCAKHFPTNLNFINTNDRFGTTGLPEELLDSYGLSEKNIIEKSKKMLKL